LETALPEGGVEDGTYCPPLILSYPLRYYRVIFDMDLNFIAIFDALY